MTKLLKVFLIGFLIYPLIPAKAQLGVWNKIEADYSITKKVHLEGNIQARVSEIGQPEKTWIGEAGLSYKLPYGFTASFWYRYIGQASNENQSWNRYHRFYTELKYKTRVLNPLKLNYRVRYQQQFKDDDNGLELDANFLRNKLELSFDNETRFEPYLSADVFYKLGTGFNQVRYKSGVETRLTKNLKLDLGIQTDDRLRSDKNNQWRYAWSLKLDLK